MYELSKTFLRNCVQQHAYLSTNILLQFINAAWISLLEAVNGKWNSEALKINLNFLLVTILCVQNFQTIQHVASLKTMMVRKYEHTSGKIEAQSNQASGVTGTILKFTNILST